MVDLSGGRLEQEGMVSQLIGGLCPPALRKKFWATVSEGVRWGGLAPGGWTGLMAKTQEALKGVFSILFLLIFPMPSPVCSLVAQGTFLHVRTTEWVKMILVLLVKRSHTFLVS